MDPEPSPIESLDAITLVTTDMDAAVRFYEALGFRLAFGGAGSQFTTFRAGGGFLNLQVADRTSREVWGRAIFFVTDVDEMHRRATSAGYPSETEPRDAEWGERYFHIHDPDGHELSFARRLKGDDEL
ncbi:MAG: VOC family protein [Acidimicrobiales bacterium]|nr:VOC family protein [Acidimicrobiales bacterium]